MRYIDMKDIFSQLLTTFELTKRLQFHSGKIGWLAGWLADLVGKYSDFALWRWRVGSPLNRCHIVPTCSGDKRSSVLSAHDRSPRGKAKVDWQTARSRWPCLSGKHRALHGDSPCYLRQPSETHWLTSLSSGPMKTAVSDCLITWLKSAPIRNEFPLWLGAALNVGHWDISLH